MGLTPRGFRQALWLGDALTDLLASDARVYTSTYRRAIDTAAVAFPELPAGWPKSSATLDEQHYGDATYMTKSQLFATYPECVTDRQARKHLWVPPGGGESLADGVWSRAAEFAEIARASIEADRPVIAVTHHTTILALRAILERRPVTDLVAQARNAKTATAGIFRYSIRTREFALVSAAVPPA